MLLNCSITLNPIQTNFICLTTGSHDWNITHKHLCIFYMVYTDTQSITFSLFSLSHCHENGSILHQMNLLSVVVIKQTVQCTLDTWFIVKLRDGVTMLHQMASVRVKVERWRNGFNWEPTGLYITLYVPNLYLLFTHNHIHRAKFLCKSRLMWSEFN